MSPRPLNGRLQIIKDSSTQIVRAGAAVRLNPETMEHGMLLLHPDLPLFKMYIKFDIETKVLSSHFEKIKPDNDSIVNFEIEIVEEEKTIIQPSNELILPS